MPEMTRTRWARAGWWLFTIASIAAFAAMMSRAVQPQFYRIDVDVYRMGAQAWLDGHQLYGDVLFETWVKATPLPFTYPPIAAVLFTPLTWMSLQAAIVTLVLGGALLLVLTLVIILTRLDVCAAWWQRTAVAAFVVAAAVWLNFEPLWANFAYGQINPILLALVVVDCVPRSTRWPRGLLVGVAIAIKLTPAVFLVYFFLRGDRKALLTALGTFAASVAVAFAVAPRDSWEYWTSSLYQTNRIGGATMNTNQNFAGFLARVGVTGSVHFVVWATLCCAALALTAWAVRRLLRADEPVLALICVALFGLIVSPVSWSHHWVWSLPVIVVLAIVGYRRRNVALLAAAAVGVAWMRWSPLKDIMTDSGLGRELYGAAYVWWGLAVIVIAGLTVTARAIAPPEPAAEHETATP